MVSEGLIFVIGLAAFALLTWVVVRWQSAVQHTLTDRIDRLTDQLDRRLRANTQAMNESQTFVADRVSHSERTAREVSLGLGKLEHATAALKATTDEISSFQKLLQTPKIRGSYGEVLLNSLLADILPRDRYETQYRMPSTGEIADAVIKLQDGHIVAIDAKFPLANFDRYVREPAPEVRHRLRQEMMRDIKRHVSDIHQKYIVPRDRTLDYAFMYIPFEAVYYETIVQDESAGDLWDYCIQHKVVPVSPNSFLAYLHTILIGLRGMKIEQRAKEILQHLAQVQREFKLFTDDYAMIGKHLSNAKNRYDDSSRRLDKFETRLETVTSAAAPPLPPAASNTAA
ncbi:MAG: DNA recombination protein RmuC [Candidatus Andersenbacteria bacterium]|nr:DNA recombination protein RmuC [Candidatus Andersenbacteria bacterium]